MPVSKIKSIWESGSLLFKLLDGTTVLKLDADTGRVEMPGTKKIAKVALTAGLENAIAFAWQNPEAAKVIVERVFVRITTGGGTAGALLDVGVVANATATADTLLDGLDITAAGIFDNVDDIGGNGTTRQVVDEKDGSSDYITGKILAAKAETLAGSVYIHYFTI